MSGTRVTRAMVRDAAARAFPRGGWRVLLAGLTSREMWGALEVIAATRRDETDDNNGGK